MTCSNSTYFSLKLLSLFIIYSLISCGSGGGGSDRGPSGGGSPDQPALLYDVCTGDSSQSDILTADIKNAVLHPENHNDDCDSDSGADSDYETSYDNDRHDHHDLTQITLSGEISLKCTDYSEVEPLITAVLSASSSQVIDEAIPFQVQDGGSTWSYKDTSEYAGITEFEITWQGPGFEYDGNISVNAALNQDNGTILTVDPKNTTLPFSISIGDATIQVDEFGDAQAFPDSYARIIDVDNDGNITAELFFELSKDMTIIIYQPDETTEFNVAHYYQTSRGVFKLKGYFDPELLDITAPPADFILNVTIGGRALTSSAGIADDEWYQDEESWKYSSLN